MDYYKNEAQDPWEIYQKLDKTLIRHCENVATLAKQLYGLALKDGLYPGRLSKEQFIHIKNAVIYHDIGKSRIPARILNKKEPLNIPERRIIEGHVRHGLDIFVPLMGSRHASRDTELFLDAALKSISHHHERFDGSGYPGQLKGEEISVIGRICSLCDYYDALTSDRPYRRALPHREAMEMMKAESGRMFDPALAELFAANEHVLRQAGTHNGGEEKPGVIHHKKMPRTEVYAHWESLPRVVSRDMRIDISALGLGEEPRRIQLQRNKNLIIKSNPRITHENLSFHLAGGNLLLLQDIHLKGTARSVVTVEGDGCWIVSQGDCSMETSMEVSAIYMGVHSESLRIYMLDGSPGRIARKGISSFGCEGRPLHDTFNLEFLPDSP